MELVANCERKAEGWSVDVPELDLHTSAKRLDKVADLVKKVAEEKGKGDNCELVIKVIATMPGIICDIESAQGKMKEAARLQEEASGEIRDVVARMREQGLTMRDIAVLLGVTPQRVAQLVPCE
ncbi:MAG: hypothetical protein ORN27_06885 [Rhodoluna sp.]|nr:hypothetical protein [Rhodoluna sp.]